jgi:toxin ParE1/3/4
VAQRSVRLRARAAIDIDEVADYYRREAGTDVALRFIDAAEGAVNQIGRAPQSGSPRFSYELAIPDLRVRAVARFPYLVFYVAGDGVVDVWRILHDRRDLPSALTEDIDT